MSQQASMKQSSFAGRKPNVLAGTPAGICPATIDMLDLHPDLPLRTALILLSLSAKLTFRPGERLHFAPCDGYLRNVLLRLLHVSAQLDFFL